MRPHQIRPTGLTRLRALLRSEAGFGLIEAVMAMTLLLVVSTSLGGVLTSSVGSHKLSRDRSLAEQAALSQIEKIRGTPYSDVGTIAGNPPGTLTASVPVNLSGRQIATMTTRIQYVNDPTPTSYNTLANYKRATVVVTRDSDSKELAHEVTYIAPAARDPYSGINQAGIAATVVDMGNNNKVAGVAVTLGTGPSAPRNDITDEAGQVTFAGLTENPLSGGQQYYDLTVTPPSGYVVLSNDVSPAAAAHVSLAPGQTFSTAIRIYQPSSINVTLTSGGSGYAGTSTLTLTSTRGTQTFTATGSTYTIPNLVPGIDYTLSATTASGLEADPVTKTVPIAYPTDLTQAYTLDLYRPTGTLSIAVTQLGSPAVGASVTVTGGPNSISVAGTTDSSGNVTFLNVPAGSGYTYTATLGGNSGTQTGAVAPRTTTNATVVISVPMGTIKAVVTKGGLPFGGATVQITGGPFATNLSGTTDGAGNYSSPVPAGGGYTVQVVTGTSVSSVTVTTGSTTTVNLSIPVPMGTIQATVTKGGLPFSGATVQITGGPYATNVSGTTNAAGNYSSPVPSGGGYTVQVVTGTSVSSVTVTTGSTTPVNLSIPVPMGNLTTTVKRWNGAFVSGATVTITAGPYPMSRPAPATNGSGVSVLSVPTGAASYTVSVTSLGQTLTGTAVVNPTGAVTITLPGGSLNVTAKRKNPGCVVDPSAVISVTGPNGYSSGNQTANGSGVFLFNGLPPGGPYTITATYNAITGTKTATVVVNVQTNVTVSTPTTDACP